MRDLRNLSLYLFIACISCLIPSQMITAQTYSLNNDNSVLEVHGTSTFHDWTFDGKNQAGKIDVAVSNDFKIEALYFSVETESLKSGKSGMDKNAYEAMKSDTYENIEFKWSSTEKVVKINANAYQVIVNGNISIAGITRAIVQDFKIKVNGNSLIVEGETPLLMTDFGIDPPKALLGAIKTGDEIKINFKTVFDRKN